MAIVGVVVHLVPADLPEAWKSMPIGKRIEVGEAR